MDINKLRAAMAQNQADMLPGTVLLRDLLSFEHWLVPVGNSAGEERPLLYRDPDGPLTLRIFTGQDAIKTYVQRRGTQDLSNRIVETAGWSVLSSIPEDLQVIDIDPLSGHAIHYRQGQLPQIAELARAVKAEDALTHLDEPDPPLAELWAYDGYRVVLDKSEGSRELVLAPDARDRQLAAVFTASDACQAFLTEAVPALELDPEVITLTGAGLCEILSKSKLDGIVFNCKGPPRPRAFGMKLLERLREAGQGSPKNSDPTTGA